MRTAGATDAATIDTWRARHPEAFARASRADRRKLVVAVVVLAYLAFACWLFEITPARLFGGLGNMWIVIRGLFYWRNVLSWDYAGIFQGLAETLAMAFLGTLISALIAFPFGFLGARTIVGSAWLRQPPRRLMDVMRGIDQLIWALIFVRAFGLGPLAGVMAVIASGIGDLGKVYSETVENIDDKQVLGVRSTGASPGQVLRFAILPQVWPVLMAQTLYMLEHNVRAATILGVVGAGGIGLQLSERIRVQYWDQACFIIILVIVMVALIDTASGMIRRRFIGKPIQAALR